MQTSVNIWLGQWTS